MKKETKLKNFFEPKTIAIVGASNNSKKVGNILMKKLSSFKGKVIPINLKKKKISGKKAYPSLSSYPKEIDLVIIAIPAKAVKTILEECGNKEIKNVIIISAGFAEIGNIKLEQEIKKIAERYKINFLGPNCFGIVNPYKNLDTTFSNKKANKGNVAFVSQSGALWSEVSDLPNQSFSGFVSLGNMADLDFSDFIKYFNQDRKTKTILLYIEKLKQGKKFLSTCKKSKKEIIAIKSGKTQKGSKAAISHTGSLATDFEIYKGAFKQANIKRANSIFAALQYINLKIKPKGNKVAILTNAGGAGALMADYCEEHQLEIDKEPIDILGTATGKDYKKELRKLKRKNSYNSLIVILTPQKMSEPEKTAKAIVNFSKKKPVIACFLGSKSIKKAKAILEKNKVPCFNQLENAAEVLGVAA